MILYVNLEMLPASLRAALVRYHGTTLWPEITKELGGEFQLHPVAAELQIALDAETDRGCALLAGAVLDDRLADLLRAVFVDDAKAADELLEDRGGLGSFAFRIDACVCLGLLPRFVCADLNIVRKIRNDFAHGSAAITFDVPKIKQRVENLKLRPPPRRNLNARALFNLAAMVLLAVIDNAIEGAKHASCPRDPDIARLQEQIEQTRVRVLAATKRVLERDRLP
jgi:DNA-binding MltR family transcriptional regulator